ncbi:MAG: hypothetical protein K9N23_20815 [Akkermansiaceae bacterium]|nr:hypothetical protein [Akkermansiaceae bacterium]MCF7734139.1 hypothetical protein [Akkermansiaceae bacterium]
MIEPPQKNIRAAGNKRFRAVVMVTLLVVVVLVGQMIFGIHLLWRKWHEVPAKGKPQGTVEKIQVPAAP